ncbi:MAG: hypothetical protein EPN21_06150 [Methylococcaceae bacterium]|nr:MAG: hypothetical protein EPN21_06150 [Methylococcaceae bacterium]
MTRAIKIFVSYSHKDSAYLADDSLLGFLKELQQDGVEFWDDGKIRPGEVWDEVNGLPTRSSRVRHLDPYAIHAAPVLIVAQRLAMVSHAQRPPPLPSCDQT